MKKLAGIAFLVGATLTTIAQDIHFSMFNYAPMTLNPANAGAEDDIRLALNYRNQWKSVASPFATMAGSYDMRIAKVGNGQLAGGLNFFNDKAGDSKLTSNQFNLSLAYHLKIQDGQTIGLGLLTGYGQRSILTSDLTWNSQYDGMAYNSALSTMEPAGGNYVRSFFDVGTGVVYTFEKGERYSTGNDHLLLNIGFSAAHLNRPEINFYSSEVDRLYSKFTFHANALIGMPNSRISFAPGLMVLAQGGAKEVFFGSNIRYRLIEDSRYTGIIKGSSISFGVWYRNRDAVSFTTLLQMSGYSLGFAYDYNISTLKEASNGNGGFEMCFRYVFPNSGSYGRKSSSRFL